MRKIFVAGNWKMFTSMSEGESLVKGLAAKLKSVKGLEVAVCPPFVYLPTVSAAAAGSAVKVGGQNCYFESKGAFTGEVAPQMLTDVGCEYVILGHSERRHVMGESDELIAKKVVAALGAGLKVILCVGELLQERESGKTEDVVKRQIESGLFGLSAEQMKKVTVAYEPVWAIGTGRTATKEQAQEVHQAIRALIEKLYSKDIAAAMRIQYGGSAKPSNTAELMAQPDVDGLLVGGASLKVEDFAQMIKTVA